MNTCASTAVDHSAVRGSSLPPSSLRSAIAPSMRTGSGPSGRSTKRTYIVLITTASRDYYQYQNLYHDPRVASRSSGSTVRAGRKEVD